MSGPRNTQDPSRIPGMILAGGLSSRMGFEKGLADVDGRTILRHIIDRVRPQVSMLAINANGDPARFSHYRLPVVADGVPDRPGPLAGFLAAMDWATSIGAGAVLVVPSDTPFLPRDLALRLASAASPEGTAIAASHRQRHFACALLRTDDRHALRDHLRSDNGPSVAAWLAQRDTTIVDFEDTPFDPFFNVNTPDDLAAATLIATENMS